MNITPQNKNSVTNEDLHIAGIHCIQRRKYSLCVIFLVCLKRLKFCTGQSLQKKDLFYGNIFMAVDPFRISEYQSSPIILYIAQIVFVLVRFHTNFQLSTCS